ncbi:MAG TPA: hypothetical protein VM734_06315 [Kofleriaceae bacterium]|jgi:hypothetical protein|nr:hypothetical protein [Kofleriaceae bacterium]
MSSSKATLQLAVATTVVVAALASRPADACSPPVCSPGFFVPDDGAVVPANLPGLYWRPSVQGGAEPSLVTLAPDDQPAAPIALTATALAGGDYLLVPEAALVPGVRYTITDANACPPSGAERVARFTAGPVAPLPTQLGTLTATAEPDESISIPHGAACSVNVVSATASIELSLGADAAPWRDVLHYQTLVDARIWRPRDSVISYVAPGASWRGRARDLLYTTCVQDPDHSAGSLEPGAHEVEMTATLPGTTIALTSDTVGVTLSCRDSSGGCAASRPGAAPWLLLALAALLRARGRCRRGACA